MSILQWILGLFGVLNKVKLHLKAEADFKIGKDSERILVGSDGLNIATVEQKEWANKRIERRRKRKGKDDG